MSTTKTTTANTTSWLLLAAASGACAAFNGVFAKLTTTELTTTWSSALSSALGLNPSNKFTEFLVRGTFFLLNLSFNALMWALFTAALTRGSSTTRVSLINTSANFVFTAVLGLLVFRESLPPLWWVGAGGLVVGTVVIGKRGEGEGGKDGGSGGEGGGGDGYRDRVGEGGEISDGVEMGKGVGEGEGEGDGEGLGERLGEGEGEGERLLKNGGK